MFDKLNEFEPTANNENHRRIMANLSGVEIIRVVDYINLLSQFIDRDNEVLDNLTDVLQPLEDVISKLRMTDQSCSRCGGFLYLSDLPQYDCVCPDCDENF